MDRVSDFEQLYSLNWVTPTADSHHTTIVAASVCLQDSQPPRFLGSCGPWGPALLAVAALALGLSMAEHEDVAAVAAAVAAPVGDPEALQPDAQHWSPARPSMLMNGCRRMLLLR